jgi:hypothetical protein
MGATRVKRLTEHWQPKFSVPGSREPHPLPVEPRLLAWAANIQGQIDPDRLRDDVTSLPGPRNRLHSPEAMLEAEDLVLSRFEQLGWAIQRLPFTLTDVQGGLDYGSFDKVVYPRLEGANLTAMREGEKSGAAIVLLAHLDTVRDTPGANDNTASVAALLEVARVLSGCRFRHSVIFALPDMEELGLIGARQLAAALLTQRRLLGVICFETMAYTAREPDTQHLPPGLEQLFPGQIQRVRDRRWRGDFTAVLYNGPGTRLAASYAGALSHFAGPEAVIQLRNPGDLPLIGWLLRRRVRAVRDFGRSDHFPFWEAHIPAVMITDTANFRYPHYHQPTDMPEKLDYERLGGLAAAAAVVVAQTAVLVSQAAGAVGQGSR